MRFVRIFRPQDFIVEDSKWPVSKTVVSESDGSDNFGGCISKEDPEAVC